MNPTTDSRSAAITIGSQSHGVAQQGRSATICAYELSPGDAQFSKDGGAGTFTVNAPAECGWTAASSAPWLAVTAGGQNSGTGIVSYTVARQPDVAERSAVITVGDRMFRVRQSGDLGVCQYSVTPIDVRPCMPGSTFTATVTTQASCPWTATSNVGWLDVQSSASGSGSGTIVAGFTENYDAPREGVIMVRWPTPTAGENIHVVQAGCSYAVSRTSFSFGATGGSGTFDVIQQSEPYTCGGATQDRCVWTARSDVLWVTITSSMPRSGDNPVAFTVAANDGTTSRTGTISVRDKVVTITQAGR